MSGSYSQDVDGEKLEQAQSGSNETLLITLELAGPLLPQLFETPVTLVLKENRVSWEYYHNQKLFTGTGVLAKCDFVTVRKSSALVQPNPTD